MCRSKVKCVVWLLWLMVGSSCVDNTLGIRLPLELIDDLKWLNRAEETRLEDPFEIVPIERNWNGDSWDLQFTAFERPHKVRMHPNRHLVSPTLQIVEQSPNNQEKTVHHKNLKNCHFIGRDERNSVAGISDCADGNQMSGVLILEDSILEIEPLTNSQHQPFFQPVISQEQQQENSSSNLHVVKRSTDFPVIRNDFRKGPILRPNMSRMEYRSQARVVDDRLTLEVALFFDEAGYERFAPLFQYDSEKISDLLLAYLNAVQALYYHPSLGEPIDIVLVFMEIMKQQPKELPTHNGERSDLLDSFCLYQNARNVRDGQEGHWDMALYVSGLDFFAWENGQKDGATMGLATVGGVCLENYNCITAEFGVTNQFGRPFPSAGFTSVYILAHEIGHNLGMSHDSRGNECPKDGFIMSPSRGTQGETVWSSCSAEVVKDIRSWAYCLKDRPKLIKRDYDAMDRFKGRPGKIYTAKRQCEVLLVDPDAVAAAYDGLDKICQNLPCRSPHRIGYYFSGPALEGTVCGDGQTCTGGECLKEKPGQEREPPTIGGWSEWMNEDCSSGCILRSKGFQKRRRTCSRDCDGLSFDVALCDDREICAANRYLSAGNYATMRCREFSRLIPELEQGGRGIQAPHEEQRLWVSCAVFCRRRDSPVYYSPRLELNDLGGTLDAYFPDGTFCHNDGKQDYFCLHHHCLPENFKFTKGKGPEPGAFFEDDIPFWLGNASPDDGASGRITLTELLKEYMSWDGQEKKPLRTHLPGGANQKLRTHTSEWEFGENDVVERRLNDVADGFYFQ